MTRLGRFLLVTVMATALAIVYPASMAAASSTMGRPPASIQPWLAEQLPRTGPTEKLTVLVHGADLRAARAAVSESGLTRLRDLKRISVTIARGTPAQVQLAARRPGVTYVEGNQPIEYHLGSSHEATHGEQASASLARDGRSIDGTGVSVAVIDTGIDPTHPFFQSADGESIVVANLKNVCGVLVSQPSNCFVDAGPLVDTDTSAAGGHGTHVNGIVAGQHVELAGGDRLHGAAPGARIVSLSMGAGIVIINAHLALEWVLENHAQPCGADVAPDECPPIKVVNNSYGPAGGGRFNPNDATARLQRALAAEGVVTVWANGNDGGDGSANRSNPPGQDPTPGVVSVASYFDQNTGTRDGVVSDYSSRGASAQSETWPDLSAPGERITSACRPYLVICSTGNDPQAGAAPADAGAYNTISGTSMAAPHIAGIVAQLFQADPAATPADVEHALKSTAHRYTDGAEYRTAGGYTSSYDKGTGLVDAAAAVAALPNWTSAAEGTLREPGDDPDGADSETAGSPSAEDDDAAPPEPEPEPADETEEAKAPSSNANAEAIAIRPTHMPGDASAGSGVDKASTSESLEGDFSSGPMVGIVALFAVLGTATLYFLGTRRASV